MTKQDIRKQIKDQKSQLSLSQIRRDSDTITKQLFNTSSYIQCNQLFCYVSFNQEVITREILLTALSQKKRIAVPKIVGEEMKFFYIESLEELEPGILGILEPVTKREAVPVKNELNLIIVPGLAFDKEKNRIGYGKGYYDRFFSKHKEVLMRKTALAFDFQIVDSLSVDKYDEKVDQIITQSRIIK